MWEYQKKLKQMSEERIMNAIAENGTMTFTELLNKTDLSRPVLNKHLKRLIDEGKIEKENGIYRLLSGGLEHGYIKRILFSMLSTRIFNDLFEATGKNELSDQDFTRKFIEKVGLVESLILYIGLSVGLQDPEEGGKWIEEGFGTLIQKYAWRRCFFRQIMGGEYELLFPVTLKKSPKVEVKGSLITLPGAFVPKVTEEILRSFPEVDENRLIGYKKALEETYPEDMKWLNQALSLIELKEVT
jgi:DNA-binding Lrp family transcriptional regulator